MLIRRRSFHAASCLLCLVVMWRWGFVLVFAGTEAQGGALTGPLESLYDISFLLFGAALLMVFVSLRVSAWITVGACLLSLPLDLYFLAPNLFRRVFTWMYWEGSRPNFVWNWSAVIGLITLVDCRSEFVSA